jgi:hypothetical protein
MNLHERFGDTYRVRYEESYHAERSEFRSAEEPWLQIIPCKHGHIYPHGGNLLAVSTNNRGSVAKRLRSLPYVNVLQDGSDGTNAAFPIERFAEIAEIVVPKRRRRLSPKQRAAAVDRLRDFQFSAARQCDSEGSERAQTAPDDLRALPASTNAADERTGALRRGLFTAPPKSRRPTPWRGGRRRARQSILPTASPRREWTTPELTGVRHEPTNRVRPR